MKSFLKQILPGWRALGALLLFQPLALMAGQYTLTGINYEDTDTWCADCVELTNISGATSGFTISNTSSGSGQIQLSGVKIRSGQSWEQARVEWSKNDSGDTLEVEIRSLSGNSLLAEKTFTNGGTENFNLSALGSRSGSSSVVVNLILDATTGSGPTLSAFRLDYGSNNVVLYPSPYNPSQGRATIKLDLDSEAFVSLAIYGTGNFLVKRIYDKKKFSGFDTPEEGIKVTWDGRNRNGNLVPSGVYTVLGKIQKAGGTETTVVFRFLLIR